MLAAWNAAQHNEAAQAPAACQAPVIDQGGLGGKQSGEGALPELGLPKTPQAAAPNSVKPDDQPGSSTGAAKEPVEETKLAPEDVPAKPASLSGAGGEEEEEALWVKPDRLWTGASQPASPQSSSAVAREQVRGLYLRMSFLRGAPQGLA